MTIYEVVSERENTYAVNIEVKACACPDFEHRQSIGDCMSLRRTLLRFVLDWFLSQIERSVTNYG